ncbi:MAG: unnamed protein product [uncultured Paraburkholderia sp.]|nr:MAG: unnamed protein product [uncultured Paraburkholderia sp.]
MIFQEPRLLPWLRVADNVAFAAGPRRGDDPRVAELLAEVGLADVRDALPKQLSGGMAQRVALVRGLFSRPDLLLLDEPFSAVDAMTRSRLQDLLLSLTRSHGTAALLVTHDLDEALYVSDRVVLFAPSDGGSAGRVAKNVVVSSPRPRHRRDDLSAGLRAELLEGLHGEVEFSG